MSHANEQTLLQLPGELFDLVENPAAIMQYLSDYPLESIQSYQDILSREFAGSDQDSIMREKLTGIHMALIIAERDLEIKKLLEDIKDIEELRADCEELIAEIIADEVHDLHSDIIMPNPPIVQRRPW